MHLLENEHYEQDVNVVIDMLLDKNYNKRKILDLHGGRNYQVLSHQKDQHFFHMKIQYDEVVRLPDSFPEKYKKYVKASNTYITTVEWHLQDNVKKVGSITMEISGMPLVIHAYLQLKNCSGGCERRVEIEIQYKLPFVGKYISQIFSEFIQQSLTEEYEFNRLFLENNSLQ